MHVVILGLDQEGTTSQEKRLFSYSELNGEPTESRHRSVSPYLIDATRLSDAKLVVRKENEPINGMKKMIIGSKPIDNGNYIFDEESRAEFLDSEPEAGPFLRPFVGAREYLQGRRRWILALHEISPVMLAKLPHVRERVERVQEYRRASKSGSTRDLGDTPTLYHVNVLPKSPYLVVPETSSERREYAPIGWLEPPTIPSNAIRLLSEATLVDFALLTSSMHMAWLRYIGGRLESRYRYSIGLVYNTFPQPPQSQGLARLEPLANHILEARAEHGDSSLADLYDPNLMPPNLRNAHRKLDRAVDRAYRKTGFSSERDRVEHLFKLYEDLRTPLQLKEKARRKRAKSGKERGTST